MMNNPIVQQTFNNIFIMLLGIIIIAIVQKGFLLRYMKVRMSFGKLILVKIRAVNRDYFKVGEIVDGFLVYKTKTGARRISVADSSVFYKALAVNWMDVDEEKGAIVKPDFSVIDGFDPEKYDNLFKRTLYRPTANDKKEKIIFTLILAAIIVAAAATYLSYINMTRIDMVRAGIDALRQGLVVPK